MQNLKSKIDNLLKSIDDLRNQMKLNETKKKRQKKEFDKVAQDKANTIKDGGDLNNSPDDTFKPNSKKNLDSSSSQKMPKINRKGFKVVKTDLIKALADNNMHESAILLKNWDEKDTNAVAMEEHLSKGWLESIREAVGRPAAGGLVEGAEPDKTPPRERLNQSEGDKCKGCGMPPKTCKCPDVKKEETLEKPGTLGGIKSSGDGAGGNAPGTGGADNPRGSFGNLLSNLGFGG